MKKVISIIREQFENLPIIFRVSKYEDRATYQSHYLGIAWEFLNPMIQIGIYYLVFGVALHAGQQIDGVNYFAWMMVGIAPWLFINASVLGMSRSVYEKVGLVAKMKFPVSVLPTIRMISQMTAYWVMFGFSIIVLLLSGVTPTIYWLQYIYYFFCMIAFLFAFGIFNSTISILARDYYIALQSIMRMLFYMSGILFNLNSGSFPKVFVRILQINPFNYLVAGFRESFMSEGWFFDHPTQLLLFWSITLMFLLVGSHLHYKFRAHFVDLI